MANVQTIKRRQLRKLVQAGTMKEEKTIAHARLKQKRWTVILNRFGSNNTDPQLDLIEPIKKPIRELRRPTNAVVRVSESLSLNTHM